MHYYVDIILEYHSLPTCHRRNRFQVELKDETYRVKIVSPLCLSLLEHLATGRNLLSYSAFPDEQEPRFE